MRNAQELGHLHLSTNGCVIVTFPNFEEYAILMLMSGNSFPIGSARLASSSATRVSEHPPDVQMACPSTSKICWPAPVYFTSR